MHRISHRAALVALFLSAVPLCVQGHDLELGQFNPNTLSREAVDKVDELSRDALEQELKFFTDAEVRPALDDMIERLQRAPGNERLLRDIDFQAHVFEGPRINALTTAQGKMAFAGRLILDMPSEEHVTAIMAHEMAHSARAHTYRSFDRALRLAHRMESAESDIMKVLLGGYRFFDVQHLSRGFELEADMVAMQLLDNAGINPTRLPEALAKLEKAVRRLPDEAAAANRRGFLRRGFNLLETHPLTDRRIRVANQDIFEHSYRRAIEPLRPNSSRFERLLRALQREHWRFRY